MYHRTAPVRLMTVLAAAGLLLSGCGTAASSPASPAPTQAATVDSAAPRLVTTYDGGIQVLDQETFKVLADFPMAGESVVSAQYLNRNFLPPKTQVFIDYFAARFGPAPYWDEDLPGLTPSRSARGHA